MGIEATVVHADDRNLLVLTSAYTAAAKDTFCVVSCHMDCAVVKFIFGDFTLIACFIVHAEFLTELLQFAGSGTDAGQTFALMSGQNQLQGDFACLLHLFGVGENLHTLKHRVDTGGNQRACALDLNHTDTASADLVDFF